MGMESMEGQQVGTEVKKTGGSVEDRRKKDT